MTRALFISDLHLSGERPATHQRFSSFLRDDAANASALYILGDLFEYWIGDDDLADAFNASIARALTGVAARGVKLLLMHGNRDFLIGQGFCRATGAELIGDPAVIRIDGESILLMHGDTLCTDDTDYQAWRATARSAEWQRAFLAKSLAERRRTIEALREKSRQAISAKPAEIMDVSDGAVRDAFRRHGVRRMIHGHTHRPARHEHQVDGHGCERWVLPDWYGPGGYLALEDGAPRLVRFQDPAVI